MKSEKHPARKFGLVIVLVLMLVSSLAPTCYAAEAGRNPYKVKVEDATPEFYVNDFAEIFTQEQKDQMIQLASQLETSYNGVQVVVSTVKTIGDSSANEYAYAMYAQYGIGKDDMGILILIATEEQELKIETGRNMQIYLTDKLLDDLSEDSAMEYLRENKFADGIIVLQSAIIEEIPKVVPVNWQEDLGLAESTTVAETDSKSSGMGGLPLIVAVCIAVLFFFALIANELTHRSDEKEFEEDLELEREASKRNMEELQKAHEHEKEQLITEVKTKLTACAQKYDSVLKEKHALEQELATLKSRYERARKVYPRLDAEVDNMIISELKAEASKFDIKLAKAARMSANKDIVDELFSAIQLAKTVPEEVKPYLKTDLAKLKKVYEDSVELKSSFEQAEKERQDRSIASEVYKFITNVMRENPQGDKGSYKSLKVAYDKYRALTNSQKSFFPEPKLAEELCIRLNEAEADVKNFDAATEAHRKVKTIIDPIIYQADEEDLERLENAWKVYSSLTKAQQAYFVPKTYNRLMELLKQARDDYEEEEAERERIRRMNMLNATVAASSMSRSAHRSPSSSSIHRSSSGSSFSRPASRPSGGSSHRSSGGLGGRPSGGGVHKRF